MAKAITLVDDFNDDATSSALWVVAATVGPDTVREANGRVEFIPASNVGGNYIYASAARYDLTESEVRVELVRTLHGLPGVLHGLAAVATPTATDSIYIQVQAGYLQAVKTVASTATILRQIPYDPAVHRWLRLSEAAGITYWEYSADGVHFVVLFQAPDPVNLTSVQLDFGVQIGSASVASPGFAAFDNFNVPNTSLSRRVEERRLSALGVREDAAELDAERKHDEHVNNNDEVNYPGRPFIGNYSKSLKHDSLGDPDPISYGTLLRALQSRDTRDFEEIALAATPGVVRLTNPQSGLAFDVEGPDAQEITQPPAPRFDSQVTANEAGELYWMAVVRDIPFVNWGSDPTIAAAISSLSSEFPQFGGTTPVTVQNVFRGIFPGEQVGPYVSQLLVKGNQDPRKPVGLGRAATDGFVSYGARSIDQRVIVAAANVDYLTAFPTWLDVQNGVDKRGTDTFDAQRRFIYNFRAGATMVHFDQVIDSWYDAAWYLMSEPVGNQLSGSTSRPQIDLEFPKDQGNPYDPSVGTKSKTQVGFGTFGPIHLLQTLAEAYGRAIRAVWWQKWGVHRRLRPEEYGGRVHNQVTGARTYPLHSSIVNSLQSGGLAPYFGNTGEKFPSSYLLPQAYPEGAPSHPAYGAGHATSSGAMATILKAFFDESTPIENPMVPAADGLSLLAYGGPDAGSMTIGGEINKLAGNVALFRNAAGVHWRSDYTESLLLGEAVAIGLLQEQSLGFNEDDAYFQLTRFDGLTIRIFDGQVVPAP